MIIGIDLGTTNSSVSYFTEDGAKIIPNRLGKSLTPSVVGIDENSNIYVGETALERSAVYYDSTAQVFKRDMGSQKVFKLGKNEFNAEELSSFILKYLKEDAEHFLGEKVEEAVISVPAYFNDEQRKATKKAGEMAGFKVERIISEPTAAAIAYGLYQKKADAKILVFDLGGGTFDVSILELFNNILEVRAVAGDNYLGGEDFTQILVELFIKKNKIDRESLDSKTLSHILDQAEKCKRGFSDSKISSMNCIINDERIEFQIDIDDYEEACELLLEKIRNPIKRSLSDTNLRLSQIDDVILVGGSTKLPIVRKFVNKLFGRFPNTSINPDEAVSLGAAIQAALKERNQYIKEVILTDVCPYTLGTEVVMERENNRIEAGYFCPIIDRNTVIPASRTQTLYTVYDNQSKIRINILQGESRFAKNNISLGELFVEVPLALAGEESIDVTYTYDINSILEVEVKVNSTGNKVKQIIKNKNNDMTDEMIEKRMEEISYLKIPPREQEKNKLLLFRSERMYEESVGEARKQLDYIITKFESALKTQDPIKIENAREIFKEELDYIDEDQKLR
ncbi:molecular chaperone HscC [Tissierella pigra]|uniref:Chaperone protein DnaK n=1 Tax=Tissierella pigra TaxID=2607614 RepID=A0A6N7XYM9_9FIRM|nr:molecular chaperone HscC [Tissierella pigra]MBU5426768.1 molecular chaperone HscC [Tissierella pigra]MSU01358.1 molecular chaperone HscC [Tissierella pigra]